MGAVRVVEADALHLRWEETLAGPDARALSAGADEQVLSAGADEQVLSAGADGQEPSAGWTLVANLPYNVATPLVVTILESAPSVRSMLVMVQREVGERLAAHTGDAAYGAVSVKIDYWATASVVGRVPPTVFVPRPRVESALVRIVRRPEPAVSEQVVARGRLFEVVQAGFGQRRKMLRRSLRGVVDQRAFAATGVRPEARAEELTVQDWGRLSAWREDG
jgi:16S rRNA (adenine1518-N6/adenine1519-N6)-dimethyltransferase